MSESMAIAVSHPVSIPKIAPEYLTNLSPVSDMPTRASSSPGGTRKNLTVGQQFGRYQRSPCDNSTNATLASKNSSTMSLEALAALLSSSPDEYSCESSPPARSKGFNSMRPKEHERFPKSKSFPIMKESHSSYSHRKPRPPIRKARSVKFADTKGLPLETVRKLTAADPFQTEGEIVPKILSDLGALSFKRETTTPSSKQSSETASTPPTRKLHFSQPGTQPDFFNKLKHQHVSLESVSASQPRAIHGIVRVMNIAYDKEVFVRWTHDKWQSYHDSKCSYCQGSSDGVTDRFSFTLPANGDNVEFAVRYSVQGKEHWDSNGGQNYLITVD